METFLQDIRYGLGSMLRTPTLSAAAVLTMALGIGVVSTLYAAFDVWLLRPLPLPEADRLVTVMMANRERGGMAFFSSRDFLDWREESQAVDLAVYFKQSLSVLAGGETEQVTAVRGSWNLLPVLGLTPSPGRAFLPEEEQAETRRAVVLTQGFWERAMGADPDVLGREIILDGESYTVVGMLPESPRLPEFTADLWIPLNLRGDAPRNDYHLQGIARLRPGISLAQARERLDAVAATVAAQDPERRFPNARIEPLREDVYGGMLQAGGLALMAAVVSVLLIACANLANLLLARGMGRTHEIAVRVALGASRGRVFRQLLSESLLIALLGGILGVVVAFFGVGLLLRYVLPSDIPGWDQIAVDGRVVGATALVTILAGLLAGLLPAMTGSRTDLRGRLQQGPGGDRGEVRARKGRALVVAEVTLALTCLMMTGLITKSLVGTYRTDIGFRTENLLSFRISPPSASYPTEQDLSTFHRNLLEGVATLPGVVRVASSNGPVVGRGNSGSYTVLDEAEDLRPAPRQAQARIVTAGYQNILGIHLVAGRWLDDGTDVKGSEPVAVVSRSLAEAHWPYAQQALGKRVSFIGQQLRIVGVADVGRAIGPQEPSPELIFESALQQSPRARAYVVDAGPSPEAIVPALRALVHSLDPTVAVYGIETVEQQVRDTARSQVAAVRLFGTLAGLAIVLTLLGVYGVMAHEVEQRGREFGIRMALGADRGNLVVETLIRSGKVVGLGLLLGVALSLVAGRTVASLLVGVSPYDPSILTGVSAGTLGAALLASYLPARKGSAVDPVRALSAE